MNNFGLKPTAHDPRDYSYELTFGAPALVLPDEYFAGRPKVLDQKLSQFCTAFAASVVASCEDGVDFEPSWLFAQEKAITGGPLDQGEDLRAPMKAVVKCGLLPADKAMFSLENKDPLFLADAKNWPFSDPLAAAPYKKQGYFRVDGDFYAVRNYLYLNRSYRRAISTGVLWYNEWTTAPGGIIPTTYSEVGGLHSVAILGFTKKDGVNYIVVQNSYGDGIGDHGLFYFPDSVFNREFTQPMYMQVDLPQDVKPQPIGNWLSILLYKIKRLFI